MTNRTGASKLLLFPGSAPDGAGKPEPQSSATDGGPAQRARQTSLRHSGLHLMAAGATVAAVARESRQAQTDRIVAQVEWEIEQQAARQRQRYSNGAVAHREVVLSPIEIETPATVARRLFAALFAFARTA